MGSVRARGPAGEWPQREPQPWLTPEDARGWRVLARGNGRPGAMPKMRLVVDLDDEQSAWVREEADRTGRSYLEVVRHMIDEKRSAHTK